MCQWRGILKLLDEPGPFIYAAARTGEVTLDTGSAAPGLARASSQDTASAPGRQTP